MRVEMLVLEEGPRSFMSKTGAKTEYVISVRDHGKEHRCVNNFSYALSPEEVDKYKGKLRDTKVLMTVNEVRSGFNGDIRIVGSFEPLKAN